MDELSGEEATFLDEARKAVASEDAGKLSELVSDFSAFCFKDPTSKSEGADFSARFIDGFLALIEDPTFLQMDGSFKLLILLHNDWARIAPRFYAKLFEGLERIYPAFADNTSHLIIAELLGEYLANADGLHGLERLRTVKNDVARAHVAHGFKGLASDAAPEPVRIAAATRLNEMAKDPAEPVRAEALAAIASLKSRPPKNAR
jgi:hypothetical protein